jgi:CO/xanthine dehydrogenase Mo-binding subunit
MHRFSGMTVYLHRDTTSRWESLEVEVHIMSKQEKPGGIGERGLLPIAPAVANALLHATGTRIRELPRTPDRVKKAITWA